MRKYLFVMLLSASPAFSGGDGLGYPEGVCAYDGNEFTEGAQIIGDGAKMVCTNGTWSGAHDTQCNYADRHYSEGAVVEPSSKVRLVCRSGNWQDTSCEVQKVTSVPVQLVSMPANKLWKVCMLYSKQNDGDDAGSIRVTVRKKAAPATAPHLFSEVISGFSTNANDVKAESCVLVDVEESEVLAVVQSAGGGLDRTVSACPL